jgi:hypothetical protein
MKKNLLYTFVLCLFSIGAFAQIMPIDEDEVIQFSGAVITADETGDMIPLPYTNVAIKGTRRGAVSDIDGFFSFAALQGETVTFSRIGYQTVEFIIPDTLSRNLYSIVQIMSEDTILLPETVIFPWPSKKHFEIEFLALDVSDIQREAVEQNLSEDKIAELRENMRPDGAEASRLVLGQTASDFRYSGQFKPQRIFDPLAWRQFIQAWKRGDFKNKEVEKPIELESAADRRKAENNPFDKGNN